MHKIYKIKASFQHLYDDDHQDTESRGAMSIEAALNVAVDKLAQADQHQLGWEHIDQPLI